MDDIEWHEFPEGEEPEILTGTSGLCIEGRHTECPGHAQLEEQSGQTILEEHGGQTIFCICPCHRVPAEAVS